MTHHIPLVWIEIGRKLPPHLIANMCLHQELIPSYQQVLLTDQTPTKRVNLRLKSLGVSVIKMDSPNDYFSKKIRRSTSQLEFWINTTYRFIVLEEFMRSKRVNQVIHQESDNVILERDPLDKLFETSDWGLAYPLQAKKIGCASIFLVKDLKSLIKFNTFVMNSWDKEDQDDMKLLGEFSARKDVKILPSIPNFEYIFDAQTYGRYLLGADARNNRNPFSRRGISDSRIGSIDPGREGMTFELSNDRTTLLVCRDAKVSKLVNIHIHSKRIPASKSALIRMISHDIKSIGSRSWVIGRIDFRVFSERLISWTLRRILRKDKDIRLR